MAPTSTPPRVSESLVELIRQRRSVRHFTGRPVSRETVAELLAEAVWSPSPHNSQPWRFTVLFQKDDKAQLADAMAERLATELRTDGLSVDLIQQQTSRSRSRITSAPVVILCCLTGDGLVEFGDERRSSLEFQMAVQSVGAVLQSLFLLAELRGLGTCWMAAPMYCPDVVRETLHLPVELEPQALVLMGYPAGPGKVRPRRPASEMFDLR